MTDEPEAPVIRVDFGKRASVKERTDLLRPCEHRQTLVDEVARTVECGTCGAPLDAVQVLLEYARKERHWRHWQAEVSRCEAELKTLKAEEQRIKARTKNAERKDADAAVAKALARHEDMRRDIYIKAEEMLTIAKRMQRLVTKGVK